MTLHPILILAKRSSLTNRITYGIDVNLDTWIRGLVCAGERYQRTWGSTSTTGDGELCARDVELGSIGVARLVQGNVLDPQEIVAGWQVLGDCGGDGSLVCTLLASCSSA